MTTKAKATKTAKPVFNPMKYKAPAAATSAARQILADIKSAEGSREGVARNIKQVLKVFKGKRTQESMAVLGSVMLKLYPTAKMRITAVAGKLNVRFFTGKEGTKSEKKHETASSCWKKYITPNLPAIKVASHGKNKKGAKGGKQRVDHAKRVTLSFTASLRNHKTITLAQARKLAGDAWHAAHSRSK